MWFDRHELSAIWTVAIAAVIEAGGSNASRALRATGDGGAGLTEGLLYTPDIGAAVVDGSLQVAGSAIDGLAVAPEAAGFVAEAAGVVFEALVTIVGAALDGL